MSREALFYVHEHCVPLCDEKQKGKDVVGEDKLRLIFHNLVSHASAIDLLVYVSPETQHKETGIDERAIRRGRKQLQDAGLMIDTGKKKGAAKIWQLHIPHYMPQEETGASAMGGSTPVVVLETSATPGAKEGATPGARTGATHGAKGGATTRQTEENTTEKDTHINTQHGMRLFDLVLQLELEHIPTQVPIGKLKQKKASEYLPVIKVALTRFPDCQDDRNAAVWVLSKLHPNNQRFNCSVSTLNALNERYTNVVSIGAVKARHQSEERFIPDYVQEQLANIRTVTGHKRNY